MKVGIARQPAPTIREGCQGGAEDAELLGWGEFWEDGEDGVGPDYDYDYDYD